MSYMLNVKPDRFSLDYLLQENFEYKDSTLVNPNFLASLNEAEKASLADMMGSGAADKAKKRLDHLNKKGAFLDLPKTKGDFKKSKGYKITKQTLSLMAPIMEKAKGKATVEAITAYQTCVAAVENLEKNVAYFEKAYRNFDSANILTYQTIATATIEFTSIVLINSTSFNEFNQIVFREPPRNSLSKNILFKNLNKFNDICRNNKLKLNEEIERKLDEYNMVYKEEAGSTTSILSTIGSKLIDFGKSATTAVKANKGVMIGLGVAALASSIIALVYLSRSLICYYYFKKIQISESLKYLSGMVEANSASVANGDPKNKKVAAKQSAMAAKLKRMGESLDKDNKQAQHNSLARLKQDDMETSRSIETTVNPDNRQEVTPRDTINNPGDDLFI